jgi:hypothetical protein
MSLEDEATGLAVAAASGDPADDGFSTWLADDRMGDRSEPQPGEGEVPPWLSEATENLQKDISAEVLQRSIKRRLSLSRPPPLIPSPHEYTHDATAMSAGEEDSNKPSRCLSMLLSVCACVIAIICARYTLYLPGARHDAVAIFGISGTRSTLLGGSGGSGGSGSDSETIRMAGIKSKGMDAGSKSESKSRSPPSTRRASTAAAKLSGVLRSYSQCSNGGLARALLTGTTAHLEQCASESHHDDRDHVRRVT